MPKRTLKPVSALFFLFSVFSLASCQSASERALIYETFQNEERPVTWLLNSIDGEKIDMVKTPSLRFLPKVAAVFGGCNSGSGEYKINANSKSLKINDLTRTSMGCDMKILQDEEYFFSLLHKAQSYRLLQEENFQRLEIISQKEEKQITLLFIKQSQVAHAALTQTKWQLMSIYQTDMVSNVPRDFALSFTIDEDKLSGNSSCGSFESIVTRDKSAWSLSKANIVAKKCEHQSTFDEFILNFEKVKTLHINKDRLFFIGDRKKNLYEFIVNEK